MRCIVTGCAGFIGSNLTDRLLKENFNVIGVDNFSTGFNQFLMLANQSPSFQLKEGDLSNSEFATEVINNVDIVFHLAANADVRFGTNHPHKDLEQNTLVTFNVLEAMRKNKIKNIVFSSTGSIYGETSIIPTPEYAPFPIQTSLYGASKLAAEGLIQAYCEGFDFNAHIFRFVSILGERYTHGHVYDFYKQLQNNQHELKILGNGKQRKSYLYVKDCIDAILFVLDKSHEKVNIFNLGTDEYCEVNHSINWICDYLGLEPQRYYTGGDRGWIGDNPFIFLDCQKIQKLGWKPKSTIRDSVVHTVKFLEQHPWVFNRT